MQRARTLGSSCANCADEDGRLLRSWQGGRAHLLAYAEDYAALLEALVTLAEVDDVAWLADARVVADDLVRLFVDDENGGVFTTGVDAESLIVRPKDYQDNATPSENSLAADGFLRLAALTGDAAYEARASQWIRTMAPLLGEHPTAFAYLLEAFERLVTPPIEVAIVGPPGDAATESLRAELRRRLVPASVRVTAAPGTGADLTPLLDDRTLVDGTATAYVCEHYACRLPATDPATLRAQLDDALEACVLDQASSAHAVTERADASGGTRSERASGGGYPAEQRVTHALGANGYEPGIPARGERRRSRCQRLGADRPSASASAMAQPYAMTASPRAGSTSPMSSAATLPPAFTVRASSTSSGAWCAERRNERSS